MWAVWPPPCRRACLRSLWLFFFAPCGLCQLLVWLRIGSPHSVSSCSKKSHNICGGGHLACGPYAVRLIAYRARNLFSVFWVMAQLFCRFSGFLAQLLSRLAIFAWTLHQYHQFTWLNGGKKKICLDGLQLESKVKLWTVDCLSHSLNCLDMFTMSICLPCPGKHWYNI